MLNYMKLRIDKVQIILVKLIVSNQQHYRYLIKIVLLLAI